jgi:hypothetical protein
MMIYILFAVCVIAATLAFCRYYASKTRLVEKEIEKVIARKFASSDQAIMIAKLRDDNAVMRNLLLDLVENEAVLPTSQPPATSAVWTQVRDAKMQRYREILAENVHVLQRDETNVVSRLTGVPVAVKSAKPSA